MGLAICQKIVSRHGGSISVISQPGQGSTFIITLPRGKAENHETESLSSFPDEPPTTDKEKNFRIQA